MTNALVFTASKSVEVVKSYGQKIKEGSTEIYDSSEFRQGKFVARSRAACSYVPVQKMGDEWHSTQLKNIGIVKCKVSKIVLSVAFVYPLSYGKAYRSLSTIIDPSSYYTSRLHFCSSDHFH